MMREPLRPQNHLLIALIATILAAVPAEADSVPFDSERWTIQANEHKVEEHLGQPSLLLRSGIAWVEDEAFTDGVVEFDIAFPAQRGFAGAVWRLREGRNYEEFYLRPHQSGNPDANQYTPVFNGASGWQLYHGPSYSAPTVYRFDAWQHVKVVFSGGRGEVYIDSEEPVLFIPELKHPVRPGLVGLSAFGPVPVHFANFRYEKLESPELQSTPLDPPRGTLQGSPAETSPPPEGVITRWQVSNVFESSRLEGKTELGESADLTWTPLAAETTGITNLARVQGITEEKKTAFARVTLVSARAQVKKIRFGYSDVAKVYFNGRLLYGGQRVYRSRDYRYLGTIGLFDELYLPLEKGENELWFAVTENFGGWGILAAVEDRSGVRIE